MSKDKQTECEVFQEHPETIKTVAAAMVGAAELGEVAELFKVLGDATRVKILYSLSQAELCVCDLSRVLGMSVSAVSHQLRVLRAARLVAYRKEGKMAFYRLNDDHVRTLFQQALDHVRE
ncbi:ArsR/SmtB family transcription factor [Desulfohalobium retbaense]|uniref:Transcriptional regulator, ArsR family n=1 Tax=Desulfohalobium retbaense (strain ATCC 49708 / DSM 5692 / JCM 16813 / HR100) TaxID=485915 RepID=C8X549_DESRD|nr:metalloregulator ArsR/SmtB family transcription factor [Desulfohalobium retbaense]ACV69546.1 transcriptional regulator, ArsR family [Desulfohalobium retbaense DSM 5692]